jgi:hypothetical protein
VFRLIRGVAAAILLLPLSPSTAVRAQDATIEGAIKATYLYKFPPFIEWPRVAAAAADPFILCIVGNDPFGATLDRAVADQRIGNRPVILRRVAILGAESGCQLVYAAGSPAQSVASILAASRGRPIVTVTDGARDPQAKGIINFVIMDNRVRFEVDDRLAAECGLVISSKLLSLAAAVRPRS